MRIRKRSIAALASSSSGTATACTGQAEAAAMEKEFLFPLVAAVIDVQARAEFCGRDATFISTPPHEIADISPRPVHKWRNTLVRCNAESEAIGGADKSTSRLSGIIRPNPDDKSELLNREAFTKEGMSRSMNELGESGRAEKCLAGSIVKKQRSKLHISHVNAMNIKYRKESMQRDLPKKIEKANKKDSNVHAGSQCRRRNGRGWRCSERTL
ncbi:hypothetical protein KI387_018200, partial [Taxus chinensis]